VANACEILHPQDDPYTYMNIYIHIYMSIYKCIYLYLYIHICVFHLMNIFVY
jgi:hypothetical protein